MSIVLNKALEALKAFRIRRGARLDENGAELLDETPHALLMPCTQSLEELIASFHRGDVQRFLEERGYETAEDAEDFGPDDDDNPEQYSFEADFDRMQRVAADLEEKSKAVAKEQQALAAEFREFVEAKKAAKSAPTSGFVPEVPKQPPAPKRSPHEAGEGQEAGEA